MGRLEQILARAGFMAVPPTSPPYQRIPEPHDGLESFDDILSTVRRSSTGTCILLAVGPQALEIGWELEFLARRRGRNCIILCCNYPEGATSSSLSRSPQKCPDPPASLRPGPWCPVLASVAPLKMTLDALNAEGIYLDRIYLRDTSDTPLLPDLLGDFVRGLMFGGFIAGHEQSFDHVTKLLLNFRQAPRQLSLWLRVCGRDWQALPPAALAAHLSDVENGQQ